MPFPVIKQAGLAVAKAGPVSLGVSFRPDAAFSGSFGLARDHMTDRHRRDGRYALRLITPNGYDGTLSVCPPLRNLSVHRGSGEGRQSTQLAQSRDRQGDLFNG